MARILVVLLVGCVRSQGFVCGSDAECAAGTPGGRCEDNGFCSFPDDTCAAGRRFGAHAGSASGRCVEAGGSDAPVVADGAPGPDAPAPSPVPHVPPGGAFPGSLDLTLVDEVIDTGTLTLGGAPPPEGATFDAWPQSPGGPELAVLHLGSLTVEAGGMVRLVGGRPLVIIAAGEVSLQGVLDASARLTEPGAGGAPAAMGSGAGRDGAWSAMDADSGAGGGGFGDPGGRGGDGSEPFGCSATVVPGGSEGPFHGDAALTLLVGGSGGGAGGPGLCATPAPGGAGGGAVQIYTEGEIRIALGGGVLAGGGGGSGGSDCATTDVGAGGGGGAGGAIFLVAPRLVHEGILAANGGGGGGGSSALIVPVPGQDGQDGRPALAPAPGGGPAGGEGASGGAGAFRDAPAGAGGCRENGGGGGGGVGRIRILTRPGQLDDLGQSSPAPEAGTY